MQLLILYQKKDIFGILNICHKLSVIIVYQLLLVYHICRQSQIISDNFSAHGSTYPFVISSEEQAMFFEAHITYTPDEEQQAMVYNQIQLKKKRRIIKSYTPSSHRDNSGIVYKDEKGNICFGRFEKLILLDNDESTEQHPRGIIFLTHFPRSDHKFHTSTSVFKEICLDEHIVSLKFQ